MRPREPASPRRAEPSTHLVRVGLLGELDLLLQSAWVFGGEGEASSYERVGHDADGPVGHDAMTLRGFPATAAMEAFTQTPHGTVHTFDGNLFSATTRKNQSEHLEGGAK